jgi:hypothetical protein
LDAHDTIHFNFGEEVFAFDPDQHWPALNQAENSSLAAAQFSRYSRNARTYLRPVLGVLVPRGDCFPLDQDSESEVDDSDSEHTMDADIQPFDSDSD